MLRTLAIALAAVTLLAASNGADARPAAGSHSCTNSETMKIPLRQLNKCAIDGGSMKCTSKGYECCYDGGSYCEWSPYSSSIGPGANVRPPTGGLYLPPGPKRPNFQPPTGPYSPPTTGLPPRGPNVVGVRPGGVMVAQPSRPMGPRIK